MRTTSTGNELGLELGERVRAVAFSRVAYNADGNKVVIRCPIESPTHPLKSTEVVVIGSVKKATGKYVKGIGYHPRALFGDDDYDPPRLKVDKYVWLYEVKRAYGSLSDKTYLVLPEDIITSEDEETRLPSAEADDHSNHGLL